MVRYINASFIASKDDDFKGVTEPVILLAPDITLEIDETVDEWILRKLDQPVANDEEFVVIDICNSNSLHLGFMNDIQPLLPIESFENASFVDVIRALLK
ncbi:hypothetical protein [Bacillus marasmi]|uniref:hypothetical protein n=1 Tax=Bacillus marasmi TaxID=1926279 RepID=UPI0011CBBB6D|nr:hypothetical protein [Bacillus marasmi]